jgi:hypothetical protein
MVLCVLLLLFPSMLAAQDAREILRHALDLDRRNADVARNYTYLSREEERQFDGSGKVKSHRVRTFDVTMMEGSPYRRLVARDDQPLSPEEQRFELDKLAASNEERRKESPDQRARRLAEARKREEQRRGPLREVLDAFDFKLSGSEKVNGVDTWIIDATPRAGYRPKSQGGNVLAKLKVRFWVDKAHEQWLKLDAETLDTVGFGGFVLRLSKGSRFTGEQIRVNDEVWLPRQWTIQAAARILLVKGLRIEYRYTFSDYKKFTTDSRVISTGDQ